MPPKCTYYTVHVGIPWQAAWSTAGGPSDLLPLNPSDDGCSSRNASGFPVGLEHQRPPLASGHSQAAHLPIPYGCGLLFYSSFGIKVLKMPAIARSRMLCDNRASRAHALFGTTLCRLCLPAAVGNCGNWEFRSAAQKALTAGGPPLPKPSIPWRRALRCSEGGGRSEYLAPLMGLVLLFAATACGPQCRG